MAVSLLVAVGRLVYKVHELVELGRDDDLGAAVALLAHLCVVAGHGIVLAPAPCGESLGGYAEAGLQILNHRRGSQR